MRNLSSETAAAYQLYSPDEQAAFVLDPGEEAGKVGAGGYLVGYTSRAVSAMKPGQKIFVPGSEYPVTLGDLAYQRSRGLVVPNDSDIVAVRMETGMLIENMLRNEGGHLDEALRDAKVLHPFVHSLHTEEFAQARGLTTAESLDVSEFWNNKTGALPMVGDAGIPITPGITCKTADDVYDAAEAMLRKFGKIVIKGARGASGMDMWKDLTSMDDVRKVLQEDASFKWHADMQVPHSGEPVGFRVEGWVGTAKTDKSLKGEVLGSPSCVVFVKDPVEQSIIMEPSDQVLKNDVHQGNRYPMQPAYAHLSGPMRELAAKAARLAHAGGVRGPLGIDFVVLQTEDGQVRPIVSEFNQRWTGQMHVLMKAHEEFGSDHPDGHAWMGCNLPVPPETTRDTYLDWLRDSGIEYDAGQSRPRCLVLNSAPTVDPAGDRMHGILFAETLDELRALYAKVAAYPQHAGVPA